MSKLIRDKYIDIIPEKDRMRYSHSRELYSFLMKKLDEEIEELQESHFNDLAEFGDVIEVLYAIAQYNGFSIEDIHNARRNKSDLFGNFDTGLILK